MYASSPACPYLMCECFLHQSCYQTDFNKSLLLSSFCSNKLNIWDHKHNINFICGSLCRQSGCWWLFSEGLFLIVSSHLPLVWNLCQMLQPEKPACQPLVSCLTLLSASAFDTWNWSCELQRQFCPATPFSRLSAYSFQEKFYKTSSELPCLKLLCWKPLQFH